MRTWWGTLSSLRAGHAHTQPVTPCPALRTLTRKAECGRARWALWPVARPSTGQWLCSACGRRCRESPEVLFVHGHWGEGEKSNCPSVTGDTCGGTLIGTPAGSWGPGPLSPRGQLLGALYCVLELKNSAGISRKSKTDEDEKARRAVTFTEGFTVLSVTCDHSHCCSPTGKGKQGAQGGQGACLGSQMQWQI